MIQIDFFDKAIISALDIDARTPYSVIAQDLKISNTMVHKRVSRLIELGIITAFKPTLNEKKLGYDWSSFTGISLDRDHDTQRIIDALKEIKEVTECYYVSGGFTLYIRITAIDHDHMRRILYEKIDNIPGIAKTDSIMELGCAFRRNIGLS